MRRSWLLVGFVCVGALFAGIVQAQQPRPGSSGGRGAGGKEATPPERAASSKEIQRGEYLVSVMGCGDCHTPGAFSGKPDETRALSGSEIGWQGPWGVSYAANLTNHETGLAAWSKDDIVRALRKGERPDGSPIRPPMPWPAFSNLTDDDAYAIAAYLKTVPGVDHQEPKGLQPGEPLTVGSIVVLTPAVAPAWDVAPEPAPVSP
jgi:mono/diheme cytochrome c family protein